MANYHISKDGNHWDILRENGQRLSATALTNEEAHRIAAGFVTNSGGGEVREHASRDGAVHSRGQIIDSDTFGKTDPKGNG